MSELRDQIKQAIFGQESSHGRADTSKENYAGARGPMQVTRTTFDGLKRAGTIPADWDHANPEHTKKAGFALIDTLADKYADDPSKVAAAYYAGEKAVRKDGTLNDYRDRKNPNAPTVLQYVASVRKRMGLEGEGPAAAVAAAPAVDLASWDLSAPDESGPAARTPKPLPVDLPAPAAPDGAGVVPAIVGVQAEADAAMAKKKVADDTGFLDVAQSKFMMESIGPVIKRLIRPEFEPTPGFVIPDEVFAGRSEGERELLNQAMSQPHLDRMLFEVSERRDAEAVGQRKGMAYNMLASATAGAPVDYVTGMGIYKAFTLAKVGSAGYAAQGLKSRALASAGVENALGGAVVTGTSALFDEHASASDVAIDMAAGAILGTVLTAPSIWADANGGLKARMEAQADAAAAATLKVREQAITNVGADATTEALLAEVKRLESREIRATVQTHTSAIAPDRRLLPDDMFDEVADDVEVSKDLGVDVTEAGLSDAARATFASTRLKWDEPNFNAAQIQAAQSAGTAKTIGKLTAGELGDFDAVTSAPRGLTVTAAAKADPRLKLAIEVAQSLSDQFLKGSRLIIGTGVTDVKANGEILSFGNNHIVGLVGNGDNVKVARTVVHEVGHAITHEHAQFMPPSMMKKIVSSYDRFLEDLMVGNPDAVAQRFSPTSGRSANQPLQMSEYNAKFDEWFAEKFVKFIEDDIAGANKVKLPKTFKQGLLEWVNSMLNLFRKGRELRALDDNEDVYEFFRSVMDGSLKAKRKAELDAGIDEKALPEATEISFEEAFGAETSFSKPAQQQAIVDDPIARKYGLHLLPVDTPTQRAEVKAMIGLYRKAEEVGYRTDDKRLSRLMNTAVFQGAQGVANVMLRSENPVVRMVAAELAESASGAAGRRSTAAIAKHMNERAYLGNTLNDVQNAYRIFRDAQGQNIGGDFFGGETWDRFNRLVAEEIEGRRPGSAYVESPPAVKQAADALEASYERMRSAQVQTKTTGWGALPESSKGYMPHKMSPEKVRNMTSQQADALHAALLDQFQAIEGFDPTFSDLLASKYLDRIRRKALGGFEAPAGVHQVGAADIVEEALEQMGMSRAEVIARMKQYVKGGAGHTKKRLQLDLLADHTLGEGQSFKLMDMFETDQFRLLRSQANRVSGEVALARHGVMGKSGLKLLRRAMEFGTDGGKATGPELEAFDQIAAELLGDSFGSQNRFVDRAMQVNSLARLGGMGFTQFAEAINGVFHVGAVRALEAVGGMGRLRSEIKALARGEKVENGIIGSLEQYGGAEFGTDSYKTVFPFDNQSLQYQTYGKETLTVGDRLLRGGSFLQGKLSFWRSIHSAQQRGFAEQIVRKAAQFLKDGTNDAALRDMGITDDLLARMRADLGSIAEFDGNRLTNFDISKATDIQAAEEFTQAVHRGVSQIIQGTFIGEQGRWAHDGVMRLMTQFRTFSLTSIEKQWARQVGNVGTAKALGMMMGAMSMAAPVYMARTYLASINRPDQDEYLEKQLAPAQIARASLNYIAMSGLAGDFLDATTAITGVGKVTGGRTGAGSEFVGNVVAPAAGLADDVWRGLQNTKEGTDPHELAKVLPFSRLPVLIPVINALDD